MAIFCIVFTARRVCIARTVPSQDVRLSVRQSVCLSVTRCLSGYTHMSPAWFAIGCIGCLCHSASGSNCVWWCTKRCTDRRLYISELCEQSCVEGRTRSCARGDLVVQRTRTKFGERAFVVAGPAAWNQLPCSIRNSSSVNSFKTALKTFMFLSNIWLYFTFSLLHAPYL